MGNTEGFETRFRKRLRTERESRGLTQAQLAKALTARGLRVHTTTIAKIEAGERNARIDELVCLAEVFDVSVDALLGRSSPSPTQDRAFVVRSLAATVFDAVQQAGLAAQNLRDHTAELAALDPGDDLLSPTTEAANGLGAWVLAVNGLQVALFFADNREEDGDR